MSSMPKGRYILKLYVAGTAPGSRNTLKIIAAILEKDFEGIDALRVIDIVKMPQQAKEAGILATPTLEKVLPLPGQKIINNLSDRERLRASRGRKDTVAIA